MSFKWNIYLSSNLAYPEWLAVDDCVEDRIKAYLHRNFW